MIKIVTEKKQITKFQNEFIQSLKRVCNEKINCSLGYKGNSEKMSVYYSKDYNFWFTSQENDNRYWNAFGIGKPQTKGSNSIVVEINPPYEGINRNIGGVFGESNKGEILLLHRGKIGGGRVDIGKKLFFNNYRGEIIKVDDEGIENELCLIGSLNSTLLIQQVADFIYEVNRIKEPKEVIEENFSYLNDFNFSSEVSGKRKIKRNGITTIERTHGIVVNSLASILENKGFEVGNDRNRDLFIHKGGTISKLFEIKTSSSTQDLYSAVGQLLIYSIPIRTKVELVMVLPEKLSKIVEKRLEELKIKILYYEWENKEPKFKRLTSL